MTWTDKLADLVTEANDRTQFVINWMDARGLLEDHSFTFPDGLTWHATRKDDGETKPEGQDAGV